MNAHETGTRIIKIVRDRFGAGFAWGVVTCVALGGLAFAGYQFVYVPFIDVDEHTPPVVTARAADDTPAVEAAAPDAAVPDEASPAELVLSPVSPRWAMGPAEDADKPVPFDMMRSLRQRVAFWQRVWGKTPEHVHLLVDERRPWIVHTSVTCVPGQRRNKACQHKIAKALKGVKKRLHKLAKRPTRRHRRAYSNDKKLMRSAASSIIRVTGRQDALERALARAGDELFLTERVFASVGVPPELSRVAIVESLYRADATSRAGAIGAFQFMDVTAREYLTVTEDIDERRDPARAAYAAARYLKKLHEQLGKWSLATTAYNTGPSRVKRLAKKHRTEDLGKIIEEARDARFGFDGQNYYAQLLAVVRATAKLKPSQVAPPRTVRLSRAARFEDLAKALDVSKSALARANPALRPPITKRKELVPVSYIVNVPDDGPVLSEADGEAGEKGT